MNCDGGFVFSGPAYLCSQNKTFNFHNNNVEKSYRSFDFWLDSVDPVIFWLLYDNIQIVLDITFDSILTLFFRFILFHFESTEA